MVYDIILVKLVLTVLVPERKNSEKYITKNHESKRAKPFQELLQWTTRNWTFITSDWSHISTIRIHGTTQK